MLWLLGRTVYGRAGQSTQTRMAEWNAGYWGLYPDRRGHGEAKDEGARCQRRPNKDVRGRPRARRDRRNRLPGPAEASGVRIATSSPRTPWDSEGTVPRGMAWCRADSEGESRPEAGLRGAKQPGEQGCTTTRSVIGRRPAVFVSRRHPEVGAPWSTRRTSNGSWTAVRARRPEAARPTRRASRRSNVVSTT